MNLNEFRSRFRFTSGERSGILVLSAILVFLLMARRYYQELEKERWRPDLKVDTALQARIDSLKRINKKAAKDSIYPFNPNFISDYKVYQLGLTTAVFDRMQHYRASGKWVNSALEFQKVTAIHDSTLERIRPYLRFPDWVKSSTRRTRNSKSQGEIPYDKKVDLNQADKAQLEEIYGIGPTLAKRIIELREKLGGYGHTDQLYAVYGLRDSVVNRIWKTFAIKTPVTIDKMNLNKANASDLATIPGISFKTAKDIWEFNRLREGITDLSELRKIESLTEGQLRVISVYLSTAQNN